MHVSFDDWPLLVVDLEDGAEDAGRALFQEALVGALARNEPFAVVAVMPSELPRQRRPPDPEQMRWLKRSRPQLAERCAGMAYVMAAWMRDESAKALAAGPQIYGCPIEAFEQRAPALAWARGRLADAPAAGTPAVEHDRGRAQPA